MSFFFYLWKIFENWWWFFFPLILFPFFRYFYLWWVRWEIFYKKEFQWILLEIKPPKEILKPFSAMENIFSILWGIFDGPNWRERWCKGELPLGGGGWFSFEICSFGGEIHFYMRIPDFFRTSAESTIYAQYPDAEITLVEDYTQKVPKDIPNEKWDIYAEDYTLAREDHYPIKTYTMFFEKPEEEKRVAEEKRLDPLDSLLEALSTLQSGDQIWIQIVCNPILEDVFPWQKKGREAADRIAKRPVAKKPKPIIQEAIETLIKGPSKKEEAPSLELIAPELRLTPVEKEILTGIENKLKKPAYECWIKGVYICKKDEPHNYGSYKLLRGYFMSQFSTSHLNYLTYFGGTRCRIHYWLKGRRLYLRKRQRFRETIERLPAYFPWNIEGKPPPLIRWIRYRVAPGRRSVCVLNIEELATIFHLPAKVAIPTVPVVEAKKGGPPPTLPTE
jgi:hypothetical protein